MDEINVVHAFSGVDSQLMGEQRVWGGRVNLLGTMEVDADAIIACAAVHENEKFVKFLEKDFTPVQYEQARVWLKSRNIGFDFEKGKSKIDRMKKEKLRQLFVASKLTKNLGDISLANQTKMSEEVDIFTFSFPCTDISLAGKQEGLSKGSGTRSGLLWECEKFIDINRPKVLLMENVKNLVQKKFINEFNEWISVLDGLGYNNYWKVLNAKNLGVPQNRERVFCVSIRKDVDCGYEFPEGFPLETRLKDVLDEEIDSKYYLSDEYLDRFLKSKPISSTDIKILGTTVGTGKGTNCRHWVHSIDGIVGALSATDYKQPKQIAIPPKPLLIKEATKKGYAEAYDGDSVNLEQPNSQTRRGRVGDQIANTLMTSCAQGVVDGYRIRKLTPSECWKLMNFDEGSFEKARLYISDSAAYKIAGNSIVVSCLEHIFKNLDIDKIKGGAICNIESQSTSTNTKASIG